MMTSLFPPPRRITELERTPPGPAAETVVSQDSELPEQGYRLEYAETIRITYADAAGLRYAQQSLEQLRGRAAEQQQAVLVEDWPDFRRRGFMLDISRDRVPTRRALRRLVDLLVLGRYNQLELYTEHTYAYSDHAEVWADASPMTAEDMRWLDDLCAARGIELVPNQNTFGHWERWLTYERYLPRAENPEPQEFAGLMRPPSTLAPTDENAEFITGLLEELTGPLRSSRINIGADETWELGTGLSRERTERQGLGEVFLDYVEKVAQPWLERGHTVEFWADILGSYPQLMDRIPAGMVPVVWLYDSPELTAEVLGKLSDAERAQMEAHGVDLGQLPNFEARAAALIEADVPFWVAPGTGTWQSFTGRLENAIGNITDAARTGVKHDSEGFLLTSWGDHGHYDPLPISYAPALFGAGVSWNASSAEALAEQLPEVLDRLVFEDEAGVLGSVLVSIGQVTDALDAKMANASPLFRGVLKAGDLEPHHLPSAESLAEARAALTGALDELQTAKPASPEGPVAVREIEQAIRWSLFATDLLGSELLRSGTLPQAEARVFLDRLDQLRAGQRETWLLSARPGGLDTSISRFDPLGQLLSQFAHAAARGA
ncbi:family 20 glycosylhydrolase [Nesterenkonia sp. MY13]|uniref:Family 20 glycosylhydrolase n=1 Tax=Nesterenkonia sedimenti TaxID=1463632 RepID=A0A7X8TKL3_9MICC|nr:family 20 glycosylhydrolase [Nesterenkonia sedimenti]NLS09748.1 family 20 glycosylhydrolase [Nesterenkonia sedimenti]